MVRKKHVLSAHPERGKVTVLPGQPLKKRERLTAKPNKVQGERIVLWAGRLLVRR